MSKRAFTILELLVAMALMVVLLAISAVVFKTSVQAQQTASAMAEIMQKYKAITDQLKADFSMLRKDGEIFVAWVPGIDTTGDNVVDDYTRMDRIVFFAYNPAGLFYTYNKWPVRVTNPDGTTSDEQQVLYSQVARICYMLAGDGKGNPAAAQPANKRILGRSQHLYTSMTVLNSLGNPMAFPDPANYAAFTAADNNQYEFDTIPPGLWLTDPTWSDSAISEKSDMIERITDIDIFAPIGPQGTEQRGIQINPAEAVNLHMLLAQGVGRFQIQGWFEAEKRWIPEVDPDGDGDLSDTEFFLSGSGISPVSIPGILYPGKIHVLGPGYTDVYGYYNPADLDQTHFNEIPGLGPALKFTFTLYDSRGVFPKGKTFTYIVYL